MCVKRQGNAWNLSLDRESCAQEKSFHKNVVKTVQRCLNKSVSNKTRVHVWNWKIPLVICSESIDAISLSGIVKVKNAKICNYKTLFAKYNTRTAHLDKSLYQFYHITKNGHIPTNIRKICVPHYVGGGGQPTYSVSKKYARVEMLKHITWSKDMQLPEMNDDNILDLFEEFRKSSNFPLSVDIPLERIKTRIEMHWKGYCATVIEEIEESWLLNSDIDDETQDLVNLASNLMEYTNIFEYLEQAGFDIGKNYDWSKKFNKVSNFSFTKIWFF